MLLLSANTPLGFPLMSAPAMVMDRAANLIGLASPVPVVLVPMTAPLLSERVVADISMPPALPVLFRLKEVIWPLSRLTVGVLILIAPGFPLPKLDADTTLRVFMSN